MPLDGASWFKVFVFEQDENASEIKNLSDYLKNHSHICSVRMMMMIMPLSLFCCTASFVGFPWKPCTSFYYRTNEPKHINFRKCTVLNEQGQAVATKSLTSTDAEHYALNGNSQDMIFLRSVIYVVYGSRDPLCI